uniref:Neur_chan_LBD domain-containing protein n=1 Tax=Heligmosomoides polygyrus TaxID=6339 RepID=A0A183FAU1_HELPZ
LHRSKDVFKIIAELRNVFLKDGSFRPKEVRLSGIDFETQRFDIIVIELFEVLLFWLKLIVSEDEMN